MPMRGNARKVVTIVVGVIVVGLVVWAARSVLHYNEAHPIFSGNQTPDPGDDEIMPAVAAAPAVQAAPQPPRPNDPPGSTSPLRQLKGHTDGIWWVAFSPDGRRAVSASNDRTVRMWDVPSGQLVHTFAGHTARVGYAAFSRDGQRLITGGDDFTARVWEVDTGRQIAQFDTHGREVWFVAFLPDPRHAIVGTHGAELRIWDIAQETIIRAFELEPIELHHAVISPDGSRIALGSCYGNVSVLDVQSGQRLWKKKVAGRQLGGLAFTPDNARLVTCGSFEKPRIWDAANGEEAGVIEMGQSESAGNVAISHDGRYLAVVGAIHTVWVNDLPTGKRLHTLLNCADFPHAAAFSPDGQYLIGAGGGRRMGDTAFSPSADNVVRLWQLDRVQAEAQ